MTASDSRAEAFTRIELMVVGGAIAILIFALLVPASHRTYEAPRTDCMNQLKQIGIAYRIWSNDNGDKFPDEVPQARGGWSDLLLSTKAYAFAWTNYAAVMSSELEPSTKLLVCPSDKRQPATTFSNLSNINVSYFVGVGANDTFPQALLGGDRNLSPGDTPHNDYGFSPSDGRGNDVTIKGPVCWSLKMHSEGNSLGGGNLMFADGSVSQVNSRSLNLNYMKPAMEAYANFTNRLVGSNGVRLIFP